MKIGRIFEGYALFTLAFLAVAWALHTGMAVTIALLHVDIHPPNKLDVGERPARLALADEYGRKAPSR